jgi:hypothetical protein
MQPFTIHIFLLSSLQIRGMKREQEITAEVMGTISERLAGQSDLTLPTKLTAEKPSVEAVSSYLQSLMQREPGIFLQRHGTLLTKEEIQQFDHLRHVSRSLLHSSNTPAQGGACRLSPHRWIPAPPTPTPTHTSTPPTPKRISRSNYEVDFYLRALAAASDPAHHSTVVKNRRLAHMGRLIEVSMGAQNG